MGLAPEKGKQILYPPAPIFLVDDDQQILEGFEAVLNAAGFDHVWKIQDGRKVLPLSLEQDPEVIVLDLGMPSMPGEKILELSKQEFPDTPVIVITGRGELRKAVECIRQGATDYLVKPIEPALFVSAIKQAIEIRGLQRENNSLREKFFAGELRNPENFAHIKTRNVFMLNCFRYVELIAPSQQPVMINGATGVGKELFARCIHKVSQREGKFVAVNIAGFDDALFSDTLFGHKKGAFTDAGEARPGLIESAKKGTLFLDEIGDLQLPSQVKLLRLLQEGEYYPVGSDSAAKASVRFVFATNQDLPTLRDEGGFRKDLYYRLSAHQFEIPPLKNRLEDLPLLLDSFLTEAASVFGKKKPTIPKELITLLSTYSFPGNVRELQNFVMDAVAQHSDGVLSMKSFRRAMVKGKNGGTQDGKVPISILEGGANVLKFDEHGHFHTLEEVEEFVVNLALRRAGQNQIIASDMLGISRQSLQRRIAKFGPHR